MNRPREGKIFLTYGLGDDFNLSGEKIDPVRLKGVSCSGIPRNSSIPHLRLTG